MRIAIIGAGKMGGWLFRQLSRENKAVLFDLNLSKAKEIAGQNVLSGLQGLEAFAPELLINAVNLENTISAFKDAAPRLPKNCILCDSASVKAGLPEYYAKCGFRFVSMHPMFGPTFATLDSLREENAIIIKESDPQGVGFFRKFFLRLGVRIFEFGFAEHDKMMAYSLSTPFASTLVFAACIDKTAVPGTTFAKHMALARGLLSEDDSLLSEILFNPNTIPQLEKINSRLELLKHIIKGRDTAEAKKFFSKLRKNVMPQQGEAV